MISDKLEIQIGVRLRPEEVKRLDGLCKFFESGKSYVVRKAIREMAVKYGVEAKEVKKK
jgi:predicted DNA-binding protein